MSCATEIENYQPTAIKIIGKPIKELKTITTDLGQPITTLQCRLSTYYRKIPKVLTDVYSTTLHFFSQETGILSLRTDVNSHLLQWR